jgi:circadian clock protein KaiB
VYRFRLFVVGGNVGSARAEPDLRALLDERLPGAYQLEVIDLRLEPDLARAAAVMAVPTVIRVAPGPERRAMGDFSDRGRLAAILDLPSRT